MIRREKRIQIPVKDKKLIIARSASRCSFPGCNLLLTLDDGAFYGQLCHIEATSPGGPRYNPDSESALTHENLILLCPNHHHIIDREPNIYTTEWLKKARDDHYKRVEKALKKHDIEPIDLDIEANLSFKKVFQVWESNKGTKNEEFWQKFFTKNPKILSQISPNCICQIGTKCYLGGKSINNKGGNLIDFLYANSLTTNACLIEIKTPATDLIGPKYRTNAFSISPELSGAIVQVLNYRDELLKNYFTLTRNDSNTQFNAFNPKCIVIAGCFELQNLSSSERKSFELFRSNSSFVEIVTYDELFLKIKDIIELIE